MFAIVSLEHLQLRPGSVLRMPATWQEYEHLSDQRGDGSIPRIKYRNGEMLLMSPLPKHGRDAHLIAGIITTLLDHDGREYDAFTPVTMRLPEQSGIEPDYCFYIDNWEAVSGKARIDWRIDPPPDLVVEIDVASYSAAEDYLPFRVPEVWLFRRDRTEIYQLRTTAYELCSQSQYFPAIDLQETIAQCVQTAYERNTSAAIRELRRQLGNA